MRRGRKEEIRQRDRGRNRRGIDRRSEGVKKGYFSFCVI